MALVKVTYENGVTVIGAENLNAIQDNVIINAADIATGAGNIAANTANIATNTENIATNAANIAANTQSISTVSGEVNDLKSAFEDNGGIVVYWGADETLPVDDSYAKSRIGVSRGGAYLTLTGQTWKGSASDKIAIKLTGSLVRATTNTEINAFAADLNLKRGHTYVFTNRLVSGGWEPASSSITNLNVSLRVRDSSNNYSVTSGALPVTPTVPVISETVTLDADKAVKVDLYIREGLTMSANTVVCCSIIDITESIEADGVTRYLNDKIDAITVPEGSAWN